MANQQSGTVIKEPEVARKVSELLQRTFDELGASMIEVNHSCSGEEAAAYRDKIGDMFYIITFKLLEPLYEEHPHLKPEGWV